MDKFQLAKYIVSKYHGTVSPMKLQKLMYYCYAWQLVADVKLFDAHFEAWPHGPVDPEIYKEYKGFGRNPIVISDAPHLNEPLIDFILDSYSVYSAIELSKTTHLEQPWKHYQETGGLIPDEILISFYSKQAFAKNFPLKEGKKFFPPKTSTHYAFTFDMEKEYVPEFKNIEEYLKNFATEYQILLGLFKQYGLKN